MYSFAVSSNKMIIAMNALISQVPINKLLNIKYLMIINTTDILYYQILWSHHKIHGPADGGTNTARESNYYTHTLKYVGVRLLTVHILRDGTRSILP